MNYRPAILSSLLALALYAITLGGTYIYDDMYIVREDPRVLHANWRDVFTKDYNHGGVDNLYRPLITSSYVVEWQLHGDRPWIFHLVNWLLHALVSALVAMLGVRLLNTRAGYVAGLLFAAHPIHVEAVANIVGRAELACAAAMLGAIFIFINKPLTIPRAIAIWILFLVALGSKEQAMLLPFILFAAHCLVTKPRMYMRGSDVEKQPRQLLLILLCFTLAGYIVLREDFLKLRFWWDRQFLDWTIQPMIRSVGINAWLMPFVLLGHYVQLLIFPIKLSPDYGGSTIGWIVNLRDPYLYIGLLSTAACGFALIASIAKRNFTLLFLLISLILTYGIISNFITLIGTNFGERLMYLPSAFFLLMVGMLFATPSPGTPREGRPVPSEAEGGEGRATRRAAVTVILAVVVLFSLRTVTYAAKWNDRLTFYQYCVKQNPRSVRLYMLLADEQMKRNDFAGARATDAKARQVEPDYWDIWHQSAVVEEKAGDYEQAMVYLRQAYKLRMSVGIASEMAQIGAKISRH